MSMLRFVNAACTRNALLKQPTPVIWNTMLRCMATTPTPTPPTTSSTPTPATTKRTSSTATTPTASVPTPADLVTKAVGITSQSQDADTSVKSSTSPRPSTYNPAKISQIQADFYDGEKAYAARSLGELILAYGVLKACSFKFVVENGERIYEAAKKSPFLLNMISLPVRHTFFRHFCAGEDEDDILPRVTRMRDRHIEAIFDYAAEGEVNNDSKKKTTQDIGMDIDNTERTARVYDYKGEAVCDQNLNDFIESVSRVQYLSPTGVTAIKLTALGQPELLKALSDAIRHTQNLFAVLDQNNSGTLTRDEVLKGLQKSFDISERHVQKYLDRYFSLADSNGVVDYIQFTHELQMADIWSLLENAKSGLAIVSKLPNEQEKQLMRNMVARLDKLVAHAREKNVKLLIDAEQLCLQPAIDNFVLALQRKNNTEFPYIYQTYQCYRKDTLDRIAVDLQRAEREGWIPAAKLVRGAYMDYERDTARKLGYPDPIHDTLEDTHRSYNRAISLMLDNPTSHVLIASHNNASVIHAVTEMAKRGLSRKGNVTFAQLNGMADNISETLGRHGYYVYKYMPYGPVNLVIPYLIRRAAENSSLIGGAELERKLIKKEIFRRIFGRRK